MKCEVILAREGGYEFYTNVKCRPYPPPYICVQVTRTPRWKEDLIYPGVMRVYNSFKVEEENERLYHTNRTRRMKEEKKHIPLCHAQRQPMQGIVFRRPGVLRSPRPAKVYVPLREKGGKSREGNFYLVRIPVSFKFKEENLVRFKTDGVSLSLQECEHGKYIEIEKSYNFDMREMIEPVDRIATRLRLRYNPLDLVVATYMKLKIVILGEVKETKK